MDTDDNFKSNLNTAKESILDEEKLVSYISLSKEFCIHINTSKKLLHCLVTTIREELPKIKLNVNHIISGTTGDNRARTTVCTEDDLSRLKTTFTTIYFEHIYSVSKGDPCVDPAAYLLTNKLDDFGLCPGLIKSSECYKRTSDEIGSLKFNSQESMSNKEKKQLENAPKKIKIDTMNTCDVQVKNVNIDDKISFKDKETPVKPTATSPKKVATQKNNKLNSLKTQKGIVGFFNNSNGTSKKVVKESKNETLTKVDEKIHIKEEEMDIDKQSKLEQDLDIKQSTSNTSKKNKALNQAKKISKVDKKRKRVLHVSDSDSDEENDPFVDKLENNHESDDEIPPTPSNDCIKITSGIVNPKKRRKIVDKTYTDEDGYILTKKEEVYESCSDHEEDRREIKDIKLIKVEKTETSPIEKKNSPKLSKKKISPPQKGKQSTLTSFFKRK